MSTIISIKGYEKERKYIFNIQLKIQLFNCRIKSIKKNSKEILLLILNSHMCTVSKQQWTSTNYFKFSISIQNNICDHFSKRLIRIIVWKKYLHFWIIWLVRIPFIYFNCYSIIMLTSIYHTLYAGKTNFVSFFSGCSISIISRSFFPINTLQNELK